MRKVNAESRMDDKVEKTWNLEINEIDEITSNVNFVIAVLNAISVMGIACGNLEIKGQTLLYLTSEAEEKMERVKEIIKGSLK